MDVAMTACALCGEEGERCLIEGLVSAGLSTTIQKNFDKLWMTPQ